MTFSYISQEISKRKRDNRYRKTQQIDNAVGGEIHVNGKRYLNFSSNDYLGLNQHPKIVNALNEGATRFGTSSCSSSLITGYSYAHHALEQTICEWLNKPKCLLFNSGFSANTAVLNALSNPDSQFWLDKLSHASIIDGAYGGASSVKRFIHNDTRQLDKLLSHRTRDNNLVISEGVFSMDGDQANIAQLVDISAKHNAWLYIDDAHSIGCIGERGQGSTSYSPDINIIMATFGKALATSGAFIACNEELHEYLVNFSRHYIYSTAMSPAMAWATQQSILLAQSENWRREKITDLSDIFCSTLNENINLSPSTSSIHAVVLGSEIKTLEVAEKLKNKGIWLTAIRPPTVANNTSRLRVTICANHKVNDIKYLAESINEAIR